MLYWIFKIWSEAHVAGEGWAETFSVLRLLGYITVRAGMAAVISFGLTLAFGPVTAPGLLVGITNAMDAGLRGESSFVSRKGGAY